MAVLVFKIHAAGRGFGISLDLCLTGRISAPPGFRPAVLDDTLQVVIGPGLVDVVVAELFSLGEDAALDGIQQVADLIRQVVLGEEGLAGFARNVTAGSHDGILFHVFRADLETISK